MNVNCWSLLVLYYHVVVFSCRYGNSNDVFKTATKELPVSTHVTTTGCARVHNYFLCAIRHMNYAWCFIATTVEVISPITLQIQTKPPTIVCMYTPSKICLPWNNYAAKTCNTWDKSWFRKKIVLITPHLQTRQCNRQSWWWLLVDFSLQLTLVLPLKFCTVCTPFKNRRQY